MPAQFLYSRLLSRFTIKRGVGDFGVGIKLAPRVNHSSIIGQYFERNRQRLGSVPVKRAPGENVKTAETASGKMKPFLMTDRSIIKTVPTELVEGMEDQDVFQELMNAAEEATNEIMHAHELDINSMLWGTTQQEFNAIYGSANVTGPATKWDAAGATMYADVQARRESVQKRSGKMANTLLMPTVVLNKIQSDPNNEIGERLKYTNGRIPQAELLAQYFGVDEVIIPRELEDKANVGQEDNYDYLWTGDNIGVFYVDDRDSRNKVTLASTFVHENARRPFFGSFTRYNEGNESHEVKVGAYWDERVIDAACASIIFDVLT